MSKQTNCILCGIKCDSQYKKEISSQIFECDRCGVFGIKDALKANFNKEDKSRVAMLAFERKLRNKEKFILTEKISERTDDILYIRLDEFLSKFPSSMYEMLERSLLNLAALIQYPSEKISLSQRENLLLFSTNPDGMFYMLRQMNGLGWISNIQQIPGTITVEAKGWQKIEELRKTSKGLSNQAFVAMWFDKSMEEVYEKAIKPAIEHDNITKALRIDALEHNNKI